MSEKRRYNVPRGTAAKLARETKLAERHIGLCIQGKRKPGTELGEALVREERLAKQAEAALEGAGYL